MELAEGGYVADKMLVGQRTAPDISSPAEFLESLGAMRARVESIVRRSYTDDAIGMEARADWKRRRRFLIIERMR